jgi:LppX_LprAFG lipoprotein
MIRQLRQATIRRAVALAALAPLTLATLVACGDDKAEEKPASKSAADSIGDDVAEGDTVDPDDFVTAMMAAMDDATTAHIDLALEGSGQNLTAEGDIDYAKTPAEMKLTMSIPQLGDGIEMLLVDGVIYVQTPGFGDGKYIKTDLDDPSNPLGSNLTDQIDPREQFKNMQEALKSVTFEGTEKIDGEDLQRYTLVLDGSKVPNQEGTTMPDEIEYDVWLDDDNRLRQLSIDTAGVVVKSTISDWGKDVTIRAPQANQIMELPQP